MHGILIALVIIVIVVAQFMVGYTAWKKIDLYRQIIPEAYNFETVKVYIPESQVKDINIDHILNNLHKFQLKEEEEQFVDAEIIENHDDSTDAGNIEIHEAELNGQEFQPSHKEDDAIWVTRGNEEKKIEYKLLARHLQDGWSQL